MPDEPETEAIGHALPDTATSATGSTPSNKRRRLVLFGLLAIVLAIGIPYGWQLWQYYQSHVSTDDAYVVGDIIAVSARLKRAYTSLRAPVTGVVARKSLEVGQVVQAGRPLLAIVPLHQVWVEANFKETQLHRMGPGQKAELEVDTYPGRVFSGTVESISPGTGSVFSLLPPENATGNFVKVVQRVPVKIVFDTVDQSDVVLRPGMSVIATVATH